MFLHSMVRATIHRMIMKGTPLWRNGHLEKLACGSQLRRNTSSISNAEGDSILHSGKRTCLTEDDLVPVTGKLSVDVGHRVDHKNRANSCKDELTYAQFGNGNVLIRQTSSTAGGCRRHHLLLGGVRVYSNTIPDSDDATRKGRVPRKTLSIAELREIVREDLEQGEVHGLDNKGPTLQEAIALMVINATAAISSGNLWEIVGWIFSTVGNIIKVKERTVAVLESFRTRHKVLFSGPHIVVPHLDRVVFVYTLEERQFEVDTEISKLVARGQLLIRVKDPIKLTYAYEQDVITAVQHIISAQIEMDPSLANDVLVENIKVALESNKMFRDNVGVYLSFSDLELTPLSDAGRSPESLELSKKLQELKKATDELILSKNQVAALEAELLSLKAQLSSLKAQLSMEAQKT